MNFFYSYETDRGNEKTENQDSILLKRAGDGQNHYCIAAVCDGMGGLARGEAASARVVRCLADWFEQEFPGMRRDEALLGNSLCSLLVRENERIRAYGERCGVRMGTTATVLLLAAGRYYIAHVGDSRVYEIGQEIRQLTEDHTLVAREIRQGLLRPEELERDPRRNVLLQCVGASDSVQPQLLSGDLLEGAVYLLCSDGLRHELSAWELQEQLSPAGITDAGVLKQRLGYLTALAMSRGERDNISALAVRTF